MMPLDTLSYVVAGLIVLLACGGTLVASESRARLNYPLLAVFVVAMLVVVSARSFMVLWLGISATTLSSAFLVAASGEAAALEAAWKYLVLCGFGLALSLLGMLLLAHVIGDGGHAAGFDPPLLRAALALMLLGFAVKAGLAPLHAWLPDAHSKAPAPISALLSGLLVTCALYALVRVLSVAELLGVGAESHALLSGLGAFSVLIAGILMAAQRDLKRLLAYSTVEHAGIVALGLGFGGMLGVGGALLHLVAHAFLKGSAFFAAGALQRECGTTAIARLRDASHSRGALLSALTGLAGMPPFPLFVSEALVVAAGIAAHAWWALLASGIGLLVGFIALVRVGLELFAGNPERRRDANERHSKLTLGVCAFTLVASVAVTVVPWTSTGAWMLRAIDALGIAR